MIHGLQSKITEYERKCLIEAMRQTGNHWLAADSSSEWAYKKGSFTDLQCESWKQRPLHTLYYWLLQQFHLHTLYRGYKIKVLDL